MAIHPTAIVDRTAEIDPSCEVGPHAFIDKEVKLGRNVKIYQNAYITGKTVIGEGSVIHMNTVIGHLPQDISFDPETESSVSIGKNNVIRENVQIHRATKPGSSTVLGDDNYLMACSHVGHDCVIGNRTVLVNNALLAGHVHLEDRVFVSGNSAIHQFCRIGRLAMIAGLTRITRDVPPFMIAYGESTIRSVNIVGLKRAGMPLSSVKNIKTLFRRLFLSKIPLSETLDILESEDLSAESKEVVAFIRSSERGICPFKTNPGSD